MDIIASPIMRLFSTRTLKQLQFSVKQYQSTCWLGRKPKITSLINLEVSGDKKGIQTQCQRSTIVAWAIVRISGVKIEERINFYL
jgi:hypothetical protein